MDDKKKNKIVLIIIIVTLVLLNVSYFPNKFIFDTPALFFGVIYSFFLKNKFIILVFEFMGIATLLVDAIVTIDKKTKTKRFLYTLLVSLLCIAFLLKVIFSYMDSAFDMP